MSKISQNFLAQSNYIDATHSWVEQLPITLGGEEGNYLGIDTAEKIPLPHRAVLSKIDDVVTASSNNVQRENDVINSTENNSSGTMETKTILRQS